MKDENKKMSIAETFENIVAQLSAIGEAEPADEPLGAAMHLFDKQGERVRCNGAKGLAVVGGFGLGYVCDFSHFSRMNINGVDVWRCCCCGLRVETQRLADGGSSRTLSTT